VSLIIILCFSFTSSIGTFTPLYMYFQVDYFLRRVKYEIIFRISLVFKKIFAAGIHELRQVSFKSYIIMYTHDKCMLSSQKYLLNIYDLLRGVQCSFIPICEFYFVDKWVAILYIYLSTFTSNMYNVSLHKYLQC
jgi:hypothetical protein